MAHPGAGGAIGHAEEPADIIGRSFTGARIARGVASNGPAPAPRVVAALTTCSLGCQPVGVGAPPMPAPEWPSELRIPCNGSRLTSIKVPMAQSNLHAVSRPNPSSDHEDPDRLAILLASYEAGRSDESSWGNLLLAVAAATLTYMAASLAFMSKVPGWAILFLPAVAIAFLSYLIQLLEVAGVRREELEAIEWELRERGERTGVKGRGVPGFMIHTRHIWLWDSADLVHKALVIFAWLAVLGITIGYMIMILAAAIEGSVHVLAIGAALLVYLPILCVAAFVAIRFIKSSGASANQ